MAPRSSSRRPAANDRRVWLTQARLSAMVTPLFVLTRISLIPFVLLWGLHVLKNIADPVQPTREPSDAD